MKLIVKLIVNKAIKQRKIHRYREQMENKMINTNSIVKFFSFLAISIASINAMQPEYSNPYTFEQQMEEFGQFMATYSNGEPVQNVVPLFSERIEQYDSSMLNYQAKEAPIAKPTRKNPLEEYLRYHGKRTYDFSALKKESKEKQNSLIPEVYSPKQGNAYQESEHSITYNFDILKKEARQLTKPNLPATGSKKNSLEIVQYVALKNTAGKTELVVKRTEPAREKTKVEVSAEEKAKKEKRALAIMKAKKAAADEARKTSQKVMLDALRSDAEIEKKENQWVSFSPKRLGEIQIASEKKSNVPKARKYGEIELVFETKPQKLKRSNPEEPKIISDSESE